MAPLNPNAKTSPGSPGSVLSPEADVAYGSPSLPEDEGLESILDPLEEISRTFPGAPSRDVLNSWKIEFGALYAFVPDDEKVFLVRPLRRLEYRNILRDTRGLGQSGVTPAEDIEDLFQEKVVQCCLLHPVVDHKMLTMSEAGLIPTLFALIMENSKFVSPERAMSACYKL